MAGSCDHPRRYHVTSPMILYETAGQTQVQLASLFVAAAGLNSCRLLALSLVNLNNFWIYPSKKQKGPTYGPKSDDEWSQIIIHQEVNGPTSGEEWSQHDRSVGHGRYRRSESVRFHLRDNTVDIDDRFGYTYGELRSIVDRRLSIEIILWSVEPMTPVY